MPCPPPPSSAYAKLDVEAMRHLVTRPHLAQALWQRPARLATEKAFSDVHGRRRGVQLVHQVTRQALITALRTLETIFAACAEGAELTDDEAKLVVDMVRLVISFGLNEESFDAALQLVLLSALIHAALALLFKASGRLGSVYRSLIDLVRDEFRSRDPEVAELKSDGVSHIKRVAQLLDGAALRKSQKRAAAAEARNFCRQNPASELLIGVTEQLERYNDGMPDLWMHERHHEKEILGRRGGKKATGRVSHGKGVPVFFSDDEEGSEIQEAEEDEEFSGPTPAGDSEPWEPSYPSQHDASERPEENGRVMEEPDEGLDDADTKDGTQYRVSKKRSRAAALEDTDHRQRSVRPSGNSPSGSRGEGSSRRLRPRKENGVCYKETDDVSDVDPSDLDGMESDEFAGSEGDSQGVAVVARHARTNHAQHSRRRRDALKLGKGGLKDEPSLLHARLSDGKEQSSGDESHAAEDDIEIPGTAGATIQELRELTSSLKQSGIPDPLPAAQEDARRVGRARVLRYSPDDDARLASPIPEDTPMRRKRRSRAVLRGALSSSESAEPVEPELFYGKFLRSGRFQPYEDELLDEGLKKHGWGSWTAVAKDFGDGRYTRAPMSLKDRARTLELDPKKYPQLSTKRGRPAVRVDLTVASGGSPQPAADGDVRDEDEDENIESDRTESLEARKPYK